MALLQKSVPITTDASGNATVTVRAGGLLLRAIRVELGTLSTPDFTITEQPSGNAIIAVAAVAADTTLYPSVLADDASGVDITGAAMPYPVFDRIQVAVAGGGNTLTGRLIFLYSN